MDALNSPLIHICALGILLLIGVALRTKIQVFRSLFIPASLIAGLVGLSLAEYGFNIITQDMLATFSSLPPILITIVFAPMLMGLKFPNSKDVASMVGPQLIFGYIGDFLLIATPLLATALIIAPIWNTNDMFGSLIEVGFVGGHGTAGGMAEVFNDLQWEEGGALGLTTATLGLFIGIIGGMIIINRGIRKGQTSLLKSPDQLGAEDDASDLIKKADQSPSARITISKEVVEPLAFHFGLIALAIAFGVAILIALETATGLNLPLFPMAMIGGLIVQLIISRTDFADSVDPGTLNLIQGLALELLIVSAIATIKVPVVVAFALPLIIISTTALLALLFHFYVLGPRFFKTQWFEHSIVNFGSLAGVTAVGLMLLRTVDPEMKSDALKAYAMRSPFLSPIVGGGLLTSVLPLLIVTHGALTVGFCFLAACLVLIIAARLLGFWHKPQR